MVVASESMGRAKSGAIMKALTSISLIAMLVAVSLAPASAGVIYEGGAPDQGGQIDSENPGSAVAMSFNLTSDSTVTGVSWWGGCYPSVTCDPSPDFLINIWSNSSEGTPGSVLQSTTLLGVSQTATTNMIGWPNRLAGILLQRKHSRVRPFGGYDLLARDPGDFGRICGGLGLGNDFERPHWSKARRSGHNRVS